MKILLFIFGLGVLFINNSYSQSIYGVYHGSLVTDKNLMYIEERDGNPFIKIFFSGKESIQVFGKISNQKLTFPLPQNEGEDLTICAELSEDSSRLNIEFEVDGKSYSTTFERIESPKRYLEKTWFDEPNTPSYDPKIVGKWVRYLTTDSLGEVFKDDIISKKRYVTSFLENGVVLYDLQMIKDVFKEYGYKGSLDYTKIPKANWRTSVNNRLTISIGGTDVEYLHEISSDSLKFTSDIGSVLYHVRK
jgi:hypothetical protein